MGQISTPPMPALAKISSSRLRFSRSTPLPNHHHRVHGLASRVGSDHEQASAEPVTASIRETRMDLFMRDIGKSDEWGPTFATGAERVKRRAEPLIALLLQPNARPVPAANSRRAKPDAR